jgi:hypothetical protein
MAKKKQVEEPPPDVGLVANLAEGLIVRSCGHVCKNPFIQHPFCDPCAGGGFCGCGLCEERGKG